MSDESENEKVALCVTVEHFAGGFAPGTVEMDCPSCGRRIYVAPNTKAALDTGFIDNIVCCCCFGGTGIHAPGKMEEVLRVERVHVHVFRGGLCNCGFTEADFDALPQDIKEANAQVSSQVRRPY